MITSDSQPEQIRWNEKYAARDLAQPVAPPSRFLATQEALLRGLPTGAALDIACGLGQNALYLASLGFDVDAVDISDVAIERLTEVAHQIGASVNPIQSDLTRSPFPRQQYQVIICFRYLQRDLFQPMVDALLPGGLLVFETMHRDHAEKLGHKMNPKFLLGDNELLDAFRELRVLQYEEGIQTFGNPAQKIAKASLVAMKPLVLK